MSELSLGSLDLKLGKHAPFLLTLAEGMDNELRILIAGSEIGEFGEGLDDILSFSNDEELNKTLQNILRDSSPITPNEEHQYEIRFDRYIIYQVRNESFCSFDPDEFRVGKFLIVFEKSKLLEDLTSVTDVCKFEDGTYYPGKWKHYGIYTQNHIIDVVSHIPPAVSEIICTA